MGFEVLFLAIFVFVLLMFVVTAVKGIGTWNRNNHSPRLSVRAIVVSKRADVSQHSQPIGGDITGTHGCQIMTSTTYFVTFQVESGDRMEFTVSGAEYGQMAEGDTGTLSFQGSRFLAFDRKMEKETGGAL